MAYNLRSQYLREQLLEADLDEEIMEDSSADHLSSSENSSDDSYEESDNNMDIDMEEPSENQRLNQSRSDPQRGRPPKHLFGKDGFKWTKKTPSRRSGKKHSCSLPRPLRLSLPVSLHTIILFARMERALHIHAF